MINRKKLLQNKVKQLVTKTNDIAIYDWLMGCSDIIELFTTFSNADIGSTAFTPESTVESNENIVKSYLLSDNYEYIFTLSIFLPFTKESNNTINLNYSRYVNSIAEWVKAQDKQGLYPDIDGVYKVQVNNGINTVAIDDDIARYQFSVTVLYNKSKQ